MNVVHLSESSYSNMQILKIILKSRFFITHISSDVASGRRRNNNNNSMTKHSVLLRILASCLIFYWNRHYRTVLVTLYVIIFKLDYNIQKVIDTDIVIHISSPVM